MAETGARDAIEHLRLIMAPCKIATVGAYVALSLFTDFETFETFKPGPQREKELAGMLDQPVAWGGALKPLRLEGEREHLLRKGES